MANASARMNTIEAPPMSRMSDRSLGPVTRPRVIRVASDRMVTNGGLNGWELRLLRNDPGEDTSDDTVATGTIEPERFRCGRARSLQHGAPQRGAAARQ